MAGITAERLDEINKNIGNSVNFLSSLSTFMKEVSRQMAGRDTVQDRQLNKDVQEYQKDTQERLIRMIKDMNIVFMSYQKFSPKYFELVIRNASAVHDVRDNVQKLKWSIMKLIKTINALENIWHSNSFQSIRNGLYIIYALCNFLDDIETASRADQADRAQFYETMKSKADEIIKSCGDFQRQVEEARL